jgi:hypothetical protein
MTSESLVCPRRPISEKPIPFAFFTTYIHSLGLPQRGLDCTGQRPVGPHIRAFFFTYLRETPVIWPRGFGMLRSAHLSTLCARPAPAAGVGNERGAGTGGFGVHSRDNGGEDKRTRLGTQELTERDQWGMMTNAQG